jgi:hypothetical protein
MKSKVSTRGLLKYLESGQITAEEYAIAPVLDNYETLESACQKLRKLINKGVLWLE